MYNLNDLAKENLIIYLNDFMVGLISYNDHNIKYFIIKEEFRGKGLGSKVLKKILIYFVNQN